MSKLNGYANYCLANLIIDKQIPVGDFNNICNCKKIYQISKTWLFFDLNSPIF